MTCGVVVIGFSLSLSWIRPFVPSLWNTLTCPFPSYMWKDPGCITRCSNRLVSFCWIEGGYVFWLAASCCRYSAKRMLWLTRDSFIWHFLEFGLQERDPGRQGNNNYTHYVHYTPYVHCTSYLHYKYYIVILQVCVKIRIPHHVWQEKRATIAATIDGLGDKFKHELSAAWLAYIGETYPDGPVEEADIMVDGTLEIDEWVPDAHSLYAPPPVVDVHIGKFSAMNMHPNAVSVLCNNMYNSK